MGVARHERDRLVGLARVVSWLDSARWTGRQPDNPALRLVDDSEASDRILAHWLAYVTDRMRPWEDVWYRGALIFSRVAVDYAREKPQPRAVDQFLESYRAPAAPEQKMRGWRLPEKENPAYSARYPADDASICRTLRLLAHLGWSLVDYLGELIHRLHAQPHALRRLVHRLDILTYRLEIPEEQAVNLLKSEEALAAHFGQWNRRAHERRKRLWAAVRDYRKPGSRWRRYLEDCGISWPQENFGLPQLELPGDVWNVRFFSHLVEPLAMRAGVQVTGNSALDARRIYEFLASVDPDTSFYPEQFDVSFDFAQRMCDAMACWSCPFWARRPPFTANPVELCRREQGAPCALALTTCGYLTEPADSACPFCQGLADGLCDGLISHLVDSSQNGAGP